ncbi:MAG: hypothetical protein AAF581_19805 [Planctomycetota bacterium]
MPIRSACDAELIAAFEDQTHPSLSHEEHVRLGYLYLQAAPITEVLATFPNKLRRYAAAKGAPEIYHETITWAFIALIHERMATKATASWAEFRSVNPDLLCSSVLTDHHYSKQDLACDLARRVFVLPRPRAR